MSTRLLITSVVALVGFASPAFAFHPHGGSTHFFGLTWGSSPSGVAPRSFGVAPSGVAPFGVTSSGVVPFGVTSSGVVPFGVSSGVVPFGVTSSGVVPFGATSSGVTPFGVTSSGVVPFGVTSSGVVPFGTRQVTDVEAQGIQDWINLINRGANLVGGITGGAGATSADITKLNTSIQGLKTDLAAIRETNDKILLELTQIRSGLKFEAPKIEEPKGKENPNTKKTLLPISPPTYAQVDRDLNDIAAMQKRIAEKEAKMDKLRAARDPVPNGTGIASNR